MIIRHPKAEEKDSIIDLWRYSFNDDSESFIDHYFSNVYKEEHTLVAFDRNQIISAMQCNPCQITYNQISFAVPYIVGISSFPEARSRGAGKETFSFLFEKYTREKLPFAVLMAIDYGLYEPYGFAHVYDKYLIKGETKTLHKNKVHYHFERISAQSPEHEIEDLTEFYNKQTSLYSFALKRTPQAMKTILLELQADQGFACVCKDQNGSITGYLFFYMSGKTLTVKEYHAANSRVHESLMRFIYNHNTQYKYYEIRDEKPGISAHYVPDRRSVQISTLPFLTIRIFDLLSLFKKINLANSFDRPFALKIIDHQIDANHRVFIFSENKKVSVSEDPDTPFDIMMSVSLLTQLLFGYYDQPTALKLLAADNPDSGKNEYFYNCISGQTTIYFNEYV